MGQLGLRPNPKRASRRPDSLSNSLKYGDHIVVFRSPINSFGPASAFKMAAASLNWRLRLRNLSVPIGVGGCNARIEMNAPLTLAFARIARCVEASRFKTLT